MRGVLSWIFEEMLVFNGKKVLASLRPPRWGRLYRVELGVVDWAAGHVAGFAILAWLRFQRRDIRVGREGSWKFALAWNK